MDAHFHEYLAAIAGMHDIYGDAGDDHPSEFHQVSEFHQASECCAAATATVAVAAVELGTESSSV